MILHPMLKSFSRASTNPKKVTKKAGELKYLHIQGDLQLVPVTFIPT